MGAWVSLDLLCPCPPMAPERLLLSGRRNQTPPPALPRRPPPGAFSSAVCPNKRQPSSGVSLNARKVQKTQERVPDCAGSDFAGSSPRLAGASWEGVGQGHQDRHRGLSLPSIPGSVPSETPWPGAHLSGPVTAARSLWEKAEPRRRPAFTGAPAQGHGGPLTLPPGLPAACPVGPRAATVPAHRILAPDMAKGGSSRSHPVRFQRLRGPPPDSGSAAVLPQSTP